MTPARASVIAAQPPQAPSHPSEKSFERRFQDADDLLEFVEEIFPAAAEYDEIEKRAREIDQLIDQGQFDQLVNLALPDK